MVNIIKKELDIEESLRKKIEIVCSFVNAVPIIINGSVRTIAKTNLTYVEPHRITIKDITFLAFNYSNELYIENLSKTIELKDLQDYLKSI